MLPERCCSYQSLAKRAAFSVDMPACCSRSTKSSQFRLTLMIELLCYFRRDVCHNPACAAWRMLQTSAGTLGITYGSVSQRTASPQRPLILPGALLSDADVSSCYHLRRLHPKELMQLQLLPPWPAWVEFRILHSERGGCRCWFGRFS